MWSPIWSLCWLFQFLPLTISPVLWLWDTLFHFYNALVVTIWQNFLDKLDHFEGRFEKENVSTKEDWPFTLKNHSFFSSSCLDYIYMVKFPSWLWFSAFVIQSILFWGVERKNTTVLGVDCNWILFYMMHFEPVSDILRVQTTGSILLKFQ